MGVNASPKLNMRVEYFTGLLVHVMNSRSIIKEFQTEQYANIFLCKKPLIFFPSGKPVQSYQNKDGSCINVFITIFNKHV